MKANIILTIILIISSLRVSAQEVADTIYTHPHWREAILPGSLVAAGSLIAAIPGLHKTFDIDMIADGISSDRELRIANALQWLPYAAVLGVEYLGAKSRASLADRALLTATSFILLEAITQPTKRIVHRLRPDAQDYHSFPSGHTATAFAGAELTRMVYGNALGAAAYVAATGIAVLRVSGRHHFFSDCLAGAGIGIMSARFAAWLLPWERRLLHLDRNSTQKDTQMVVVPSASTDGALLSLVITL